MAIINKLRRDTTDLNLNAGEGGFQQAAEGCVHRIATPIDGRLPSPILQPITLELKDTSHDNLTVDLQALTQMQVWAEQYMKDRTVKYPVWWHSKLDGETGERRALMRRIDAEFLRSWHGGDATAFNMPLAAAFLRQPYWERTTHRSMPEYKPVSGAAALVYDYTMAGYGVAAHDIAGNAPARIPRCRITSKNDSLDRFWFGILSADRYKQTLANFIPIWELENGTNNPAESGITDEIDATASGGNMVEVTEVSLEWDDTWQRVLRINLEDVYTDPADYPDSFGYFLWLLRGKVDSGTWDIQLRFGYQGMNDVEYIHGPIKSLATGGLWDWFEMGPAKLGALDRQIFETVSHVTEQEYSIQLWARRTSGSGDLNVDCLVPIPLLEGYLVVKGANIGDPDDLFFGESPLGHTQCWCLTYTGGTKISTFPEFEAHNFRLPPGDGRMIVAYARATQSVLSDRTWMCEQDNGEYYECWSSLRGTE